MYIAKIIPVIKFLKRNNRPSQNGDRTPTFALSLLLKPLRLNEEENKAVYFTHVTVVEKENGHWCTRGNSASAKCGLPLSMLKFPFDFSANTVTLDYSFTAVIKININIIINICIAIIIRIDVNNAVNNKINSYSSIASDTVLDFGTRSRIIN